MYKNAWCTCKVVVLPIKPIAFLTFLLPSASLDLKVSDDGGGGEDDDDDDDGGGGGNSDDHSSG